MFCSKCGSELAEGSAFCHKCGSQILNPDFVKKADTSQSQTQPQAEEPKKESTVKDSFTNLQGGEKKDNKKIVLGVVSAIVLLFIIAAWNKHNEYQARRAEAEAIEYGMDLIDSILDLAR